MTSGFSGTSVTIGAAGAANSGAAGGNGGNTVFGSFTANGGSGGGTFAAAASGNISGGGGGTASGGNILNIKGTAGFMASSNVSSSIFIASNGGDSFLGSGGFYGLNAAGVAAGGYGGGGGGCLNGPSMSAFAGGAGTVGVVIVWEYA
jgi:hypothetical protein